MLLYLLNYVKFPEGDQQETGFTLDERWWTVD
jgi:hypothetical protein